MNACTTAPAREAEKPFRAALQAGDAVTALTFLKGREAADAMELMLRAGFTISHDTRRQTKAFWSEIQTNIMRACRSRKDGYGLRADNHTVHVALYAALTK